MLPLVYQYSIHTKKTCMHKTSWKYKWKYRNKYTNTYEEVPTTQTQADINTHKQSNRPKTEQSEISETEEGWEEERVKERVRKSFYSAGCQAANTDEHTFSPSAASLFFPLPQFYYFSLLWSLLLIDLSSLGSYFVPFFAWFSSFFTFSLFLTLTLFTISSALFLSFPFPFNSHPDLHHPL